MIANILIGLIALIILIIIFLSYLKDLEKRTLIENKNIKENKKREREYENLVSSFFKKNGLHVRKYNKDNIDLVFKNKNLLILIFCKSSQNIKEEDINSFLDGCTKYITKNKIEEKTYSIERVIVTKEAIKDKKFTMYLKNNNLVKSIIINKG